MLTQTTTDGKYTLKYDWRYCDAFGYYILEHWLEDAQGNEYGLEKIKEWNLEFPPDDEDEDEDEEPLTEEELLEIEGDKRYHELRDMWIEEARYKP